MKITFYGGAREVTGSKHLIETDGKRVLIDCGLFQGHRAEANEKNRNLPFDPATIDAVVLGHAHIDHSGNIPSLVKNGFEGPIFSTKPTDDLCQHMLADSAYLQERDVEFVNKKRIKAGEEPIEPIYAMQDALNAIKHFVPRDYRRWFGVTPTMKVIFREAGHILGSAIPEFEITEGEKCLRMAYAVDLGRHNLPLLRDPDRVSRADTLILESTYGDRLHDPIENAKTELANAVNETIKREGKVIIPSFAMERTQELIYYLHELHIEDRIPEIPIIIDSPLAINITQVFRRNLSFLDKEAQALIAKHEDPFGFGKVRYTRLVDESKQLNNDPRPMIIISASGMCEAGRILHHLRNNIGDERNMILAVGYMAEHTLGRRLIDRINPVKIFGEEHKVRAQVKVLNTFSAHADRDELVQFVKNCGKRLQRVFLVHGEEQQSLALEATLRKTFPHLEISVPHMGESFEL
ncbi:MAG TPA: MBL fold metallo-hydrolase [candidate division Zixibacteria bacterium]|nr:MBL fold metallo-hydrolase [candidate division Zixibacteria bacterium]